MSARTTFVVAVAWGAAAAGAATIAVSAGTTPTRLRAALIATADDAMRPVCATVWLRAGSGAGR